MTLHSRYTQTSLKFKHPQFLAFKPRAGQYSQKKYESVFWRKESQEFHIEQVTASSKEIPKSHQFLRIAENGRSLEIVWSRFSAQSKVSWQIAQDCVQLDFDLL